MGMVKFSPKISRNVRRKYKIALSWCSSISIETMWPNSIDIQTSERRYTRCDFTIKNNLLSQLVHLQAADILALFQFIQFIPNIQSIVIHPDLGLYLWFQTCRGRCEEEAPSNRSQSKAGGAGTSTKWCTTLVGTTLLEERLHAFPFWKLLWY